MSTPAVVVEAEMRAAERHNVRLQAEARHSGTVRVSGVISDLSSTGFRFETPSYVPLGTKLQLRVNGMQGFDAVVVREGRGQIGCAFLKPLYGPILRSLTSALD